jgi:2-keto-4-pentenoate hydratase/2-oxohepta-3-ene-1,7-dioic acid hydratase in catechol pathway
MRLVGFEGADGVMIGRVDESGALFPIAQREAFWRDIDGAMAAARATGGLTLGEARQRPAVPLGARVICVGLNYRKHAQESGGPIPTVPIIFARWWASLASDGDLVPAIEERFDWEGELGVVIGKPMFRVDAKAGLAGVFGYCAFNDLSARTFQFETPQWTLGKNSELSGPMGSIVTADEVGDPGDGLRLTTRRNGEIVQDDTTADMIFSVGAIIAHVSRVMRLNPGDLIATGTPSGVGAARKPPVFLAPGDLVEVEIEKVGKVANPIVAPPPPTS